MGGYRRWFIEIIEAEGQCSGALGTSALGHGTQIWSRLALPITLELKTERQILSELQDLALIFMEQRA